MIDTAKNKTASQTPTVKRLGKLMATVAMPFVMVACTGSTSENQISSYSAPADYDRAAANGVSAVRDEAAEKNDNSFLTLAREMAASGDHAAAIPLYRRSLSWYSSDLESMIGLGTSLAAVGQYNEAIEVFGDAGSDVRALKGMAKAYIALDRPTRAIPLLNSALDIQPNDVETMGSLALSLQLQGHARAAHAVYQDALAIDPVNLKLLNNYGLSLALHDQTDEAINILKQAAQHQDAGAAHRQNLAMAYALDGNTLMSSRLLSIDSGPQTTNDNLSYYRTLANLPVQDRFNAVMRQSVSDKTDIAEPANEIFDEDDRERQITVARLVEERPPEPEVAVVEEEDPSVPALLGPEGWALQIAAYRTKGELRPGWEKLKKKYNDIIGHLEPRRSEVDFGNRNTKPKGKYYRLNAGPLTSFEEADEACKKILARGNDCWVRPPLKAEGDLPKNEDDVKRAKPFDKLYEGSSGGGQAAKLAPKPQKSTDKTA